MPTAGVRVSGLRELQRACRASEREVRLGVRSRLREAAEPVRAAAEQLAVGNIRNIGAAWSRMRTGVTASAVYVAPAARRRGGSARPNLGGLLMREAMEPALEQRRGEVEHAVEKAIDDIADRNW